MNRTHFKKGLVMLATAYAGDQLNTRRAQIYEKIFEQKTGFEHPWDRIFTKLATEQEFFPVPKVILDTMAEMGCIQSETSLEEYAKQIVEEVVCALEVGGNVYETLGRDKYNLMKHVLGVTPFDVQNGAIVPKFHRKAWAQRLVLHFKTEHESLPDSGGPGLQLGGIVKELK